MIGISYEQIDSAMYEVVFGEKIKHGPHMDVY